METHQSEQWDESGEKATGDAFRRARQPRCTDWLRYGLLRNNRKKEKLGLLLRAMVEAIIAAIQDSKKNSRVFILQGDVAMVDAPDGGKAKSIILCSDGTGNSGGKGRGTNVWRLYQAIDLSDGTQVAFHDDGVGTQDNKILRAIGGATGFGLGRNIRELYASLVRVYNVGDRVYAFGFSRGAYTIRSLVNFIHEFGILDRHAFDTPGELEYEIARLYDAYRKGRDGEQVRANAPERYWERAPGVIAFLGVWDTVDAIGVPFDELRTLIRNFISYHHKYELNPSIMAAFHALAIDDERRTFHPTMFDESRRSMLPDGRPQVVEQVWFAGVHSNIGGGYPKDQLAFITLEWMMRKLMDDRLYPGCVPLKFQEGVLDQYADAANPYGKMYDSRSGLAAYYRVSPRDIGVLCRTAGADDPKIHASAMARISNRTGGYAPCNIPDEYEVVDGGPAYSSPLCDAQTVHLGEHGGFLKWAGALNGWRKRLYDAFLITTVLFVAVIAWQMIFFRDAEVAGWLAVAASAAKAIMPDFAAGAVDAAFMRVGWLVLFGGLFLFMVWVRGILKRTIRDLSGMGWRAVYLTAYLKHPSNNDGPQKKSQREKQLELLEKTKAKVSKSYRAAIAWAFGKSGLGGWLSGGFAVLLVVLGIYLIGWQHPASDWADACSGRTYATARIDGSWHITQFRTSEPCYRTGVPMKQGAEYLFDISTENWFDSTIAAGPAGLKGGISAETSVMKFFKPMLRVKGQEYFTLIGQVVQKVRSSSGDETRIVRVGAPFPIANGTQAVRAPENGELMLFVNDVLCRLCPSGTFTFYANNKGRAVIRIRAR